jgi:hypothetical protein
VTGNGKAPAPAAARRDLDESDAVSIDDLTLDEIDQWEVATGAAFTEANQMKQVGAALWAAARRRGEDVSPGEVMRRTRAADLARLVSLDPTGAAAPSG